MSVLHILRRDLIAVALVSLACATILVAGCGRIPTTDFVADGGSYTGESLRETLTEADLSGFAKIETADASAAREDALVGLRRRGDDASDVATLLTRGFPERTAAVPALVEGAEFEGVEAWVVIEAWGEEGGSLTHRRVWVFDRSSGQILWSASEH